MSTAENTATKPDVYARVTSQIVNAIEPGVGNWRMPWHTSGRFAFSPINVARSMCNARCGMASGGDSSRNPSSARQRGWRDEPENL